MRCEIGVHAALRRPSGDRMGFVFELALRGESSARKDIERWLTAGAADALATLPDLDSLDVYTPARGPAHDPFNHDGPGPLMQILIDFPSREALRSALSGIVRAVEPFPAGIAPTGAALERRFYTVANKAEPASLQAPFSYVVRYHRPAEDEALFIKNYLATHPQTQAHLPRIRAIMCYLPLDGLNAPDLPSPDYLVGNEVVFDTVDDFNLAMLSPVREELRAHYRAFPRFTGAHTHHPMQRVRFAG